MKILEDKLHGPVVVEDQQWNDIKDMGWVRAHPDTCTYVLYPAVVHGKTMQSTTTALHTPKQYG
jgi:hypothetical protein